MKSSRFWWIDVIYPLALAVLLFTSLTYVVYAGPRQSRLSLHGERELLEFSLRHARPRHSPPQELPSAQRVLVVSAQPFDLTKLGRAPLGLSPDASAQAYARVIGQLAEAGTPLIVVRWDTEAHPLDEIYDLPLIETLKRLPPTTRVLFAVPDEAFAQLPQELQKLVIRADDGLCSEPETINIECTYLPDFKEWIAQELLLELQVLPPGTDAESVPWLSTRLSSVYPRYILNLDPPDSFATFSFTQALDPAHADALRGYRVAFVGADQSGAVATVGTSMYNRRVLTVFDRSGTNLEVAGTPLHVLWAMMARMFLTKSMVVVPHGWLIILSTALFCLLITVAMGLFGGPAALGMFLVAAGCAPLINAWGIRHFQVYLPLFDDYYFGLSTFVAAGLGRLSVTAYQRWRLAAQQRLHTRAADLKGNFISLLSHNLNTPVAKMQGMVGLLVATPEAKPWTAALNETQKLVAQLEHSIRAVLIASALQEGAVAETPRTLKSLTDEFQNAVVPGLRRLGLKPTVNLLAPPAELEDLAYVPMLFDPRAVVMGLGAICALFCNDGSEPHLQLTFTVVPGLSGDGDEPCLQMALKTTGAWPAAGTLQSLIEGTAQPRHLSGDAFLPDVLSSLVVLVVRQYRGRIWLQDGTLLALLTPA